MSIVQTLPAAPQRLETGIVQVGNDWPGMFIRGDDALGMASMFNMMADCIERGDNVAVIAGWLRREAEKLRAVRTDS